MIFVFNMSMFKYKIILVSIVISNKFFMYFKVRKIGCIGVNVVEIVWISIKVIMCYL